MVAAGFPTQILYLGNQVCLRGVKGGEGRGVDNFNRNRRMFYGFYEERGLMVKKCPAVLPGRTHSG